jgi:hypothetical protein
VLVAPPDRLAVGWGGAPFLAGGSSLHYDRQDALECRSVVQHRHSSDQDHRGYHVASPEAEQSRAPLVLEVALPSLDESARAVCKFNDLLRTIPTKMALESPS